MKNTLRIEEVMQFALSVYLYNQLSYSGWLYAALFLAPDIGMAGYVFGTRAGAITYNILHHKGLAIVIYLIGIYASYDTLAIVGLILFGHSAFDRILGFGLKYFDNFKHTHLGWIGNQ
jgi:hypothetical protein